MTAIVELLWLCSFKKFKYNCPSLTKLQIFLSSVCVFYTPLNTASSFLAAKVPGVFSFWES